MDLSIDQEFDTYIKFIKNETKSGYVDVVINYEVKNQIMDIDDFIKIGCCNQPFIKFKDALPGPKSILNAIGMDTEGKNSFRLDLIIKFIDETIQNSELVSQKVLFCFQLFKYIKLNIYNHVFKVKRQQKQLPQPNYEYIFDNNFKQEITEYLNDVQLMLKNNMDADNHPKLYLYFLETPISVFQKKIIRICVATNNIQTLDQLNTPFIFLSNILGCLEVPNKMGLGQNQKDFEEMMQTLMTKHVIFIDLSSTQNNNLVASEIKSGYYRYSNEFKQGFRMIVDYISTKVSLQ